MKSTIISLALMAFAAAGAQAVTWDFSTLSDADRSALNADTENWKYESDNNRWLNQKTMSDAPLMANGVELQHTAGLRYSATAADQVRVDDKKKSVTINNKAASFTIPGLKAGDKVTVSAQSSSGSTPAGSNTPTSPPSRASPSRPTVSTTWAPWWPTAT